MKKTLKTIALCLCYIFAFTTNVLANENQGMVVGSTYYSEKDLTDITAPSTPEESKIHFYCLDDNYIDIVDANQLKDAVQLINSANMDYSMDITVQFESNIQKNQDYIEILNQRKTIKNTEDIQAFRTQLNSFSKMYHEE